MQIVKPLDTNLILKAPGCYDLPVVRQSQDGVNLYASLWKPSPQEVLMIKMGFPILLEVFGNGHPPVRLGVAAQTDRVMRDGTDPLALDEPRPDKSAPHQAPDVPGSENA